MTWTRFLWLLLLQILSAVICAKAAQQAFSASQYDDGLFTPLEDLHALSASSYTILQHPKFPAYSVRIKESHFCDGSAR